MDDEQKEPPRFVIAVVKTDINLMVHVFTPVVNWIDWRFHKNQYDQAAVVISAGLALNVADNFKNLTTSGGLWWIALFGALASGLLVWSYAQWLKKLTIASRQYERRPDQLTREQAFFMIPIFPPVRLFLLVLGSVVTACEVASAIQFRTLRLIEGAAFSPWMIVIAVGLYVSGCLPPGRPRREKKEKARPLVGAAAPVPTR
jgi:hypothetical protein